MPHFPPKSYNIQACENTEYFKTQDEQTKGEQEKASSFKVRFNGVVHLGAASHILL